MTQEEKIDDRAAELYHSESGLDDRKGLCGQLAACEARIDELEAALAALPEAPMVKDAERDVCASCGHYRETHRERCDGWMPAGAGHHLATCPCAGFTSRAIALPEARRQEEQK